MKQYMGVNSCEHWKDQNYMDKSNSLEHLFPMNILMNRKSKFRTVIDVGVNTIRYLDFYSQYFDNVIGFEPNKITYDHMVPYIRNNVRLHNICLSNKSETIDFYSCLIDSGYSTMNVARYNELLAGGQFSKFDFVVSPMDTYTIDDFANDHDNVDLLKIDAEDEDINILMGAIHLIERDRPVIQMEHVLNYDNTDLFFDTISRINYIEIHPYFESRNHYFIPKEEMT